MTRRTIVIDIDDGPDGGGGPALCRALAARGAPFLAITFDAMASGYAALDPAAAVLLVDPDAPTPAEPPFTAKDRVIPATPRALDWLDRIAAVHGSRLPAETRAALALPRATAWLTFSIAAMPAVEHQTFVAAPARDVMHYSGRGYLFAASGRWRAVQDGEEAWFRLRALERRGDWPAAFIPGTGAAVVAFAMTVTGGKVSSLALMAADTMHDSWRMALGRTIEARPRVKAFAALAKAIAADGLFHGLVLRRRGEAKLRLVAVRPGPPTWLGAAGDDGGALIDALLATRATKEPRLAPEGRYHVACPADRPVFAKDLLSRIAAHG